MGLEELNEIERKYHERCDNLKMGYYCTEQGERCWWPGCKSSVYSCYSWGLCSKHFQRFKKNTLLTCTFDEYGKGEAADLLLEFTEIATRKGVSPEEFLTMAFMTAIELGRE